MNTKINLCGIEMKNPVTVASGTFGYGREYSNFIDLNRLGGIITKGTSLKPRPGNKPPRICETPGGMLNSTWCFANSWWFISWLSLIHI